MFWQLFKILTVSSFIKDVMILMVLLWLKINEIYFPKKKKIIDVDIENMSDEIFKFNKKMIGNLRTDDEYKEMINESPSKNMDGPAIETRITVCNDILLDIRNAILYLKRISDNVNETKKKLILDNYNVHNVSESYEDDE